MSCDVGKEWKRSGFPMRETIQNANGKQFHAVSLSGGKDSTAMLLLMIERDKYEEAHRAELTLWNAASRYLHANLTDTKTLPISKWKHEYADLKEQRDTDYTKLKATRAEVAELQKIRKCVDIALKAEQPEQTQNHTKRQEQER